MRAWILSTGDELVRGRTQDTNTAEIARALQEQGVSVAGASLVGDDVDELARAIRAAAERADVIVVSGGLGPTEDDCTRAAAARAAGVPVVRVRALERALRARFAARSTEMPASNLLQADQPKGATTLPNPHGTAAGFTLAVGDARLFALPGPPHEMRRVLQDAAMPRILELRGRAARVVRTRSLETFGMREASVGEALAELMERGRRPRVGTTASRGTIRVVLHDEGPPRAVDARLAKCEAEIRRRLGRIVFGVNGETLPEVVHRLLKERGLTVGTAESFTGGLVAAALTEIPGSSAALKGGVVAYDADAKKLLLGIPRAATKGAKVYTPTIARRMARAARRVFGADVGIGTTGVAGPEPDQGVAKGCVWIAVDVGGKVTHRALVLPGGRDLVREISVKAALDLLRRRLADS